MRSFREEEVTSEELSTMGWGPEEPPGSCSPEDQIQSVSMGLPTGQERTGPEEAEATVRGGEYRKLKPTIVSHPSVHPVYILILHANRANMGTLALLTGPWVSHIVG